MHCDLGIDLRRQPSDEKIHMQKAESSPGGFSTLPLDMIWQPMPRSTPDGIGFYRSRSMVSKCIPQALLLDPTSISGLLRNTFKGIATSLKEPQIATWHVKALSFTCHVAIRKHVLFTCTAEEILCESNPNVASMVIIIAWTVLKWMAEILHALG